MSKAPQRPPDQLLASAARKCRSKAYRYIGRSFDEYKRAAAILYDLAVRAGYPARHVPG